MFKLKNNQILTSYQIAILKNFFSSEIGEQFFLTGGTALSAFYLGHRESQDLDLFTLEKFDSWRLNRIIDQIRLGLSAEVKTKVQTPDYEEIYLENKKEKWTQRLDFVFEQPVVFGKRVNIEGVIVDNLENIASNKILTIYGRLEPKDYLDLYFIFKETPLNFMEIFTKTKKKDSGLHEFYFANLIADVRKITNFPPTIKPFKREDLIDFYLDLSKKLFEKIRPE